MIKSSGLDMSLEFNREVWVKHTWQSSVDKHYLKPQYQLRSQGAGVNREENHELRHFNLRVKGEEEEPQRKIKSD